MLVAEYLVAVGPDHVRPPGRDRPGARPHGPGVGRTSTSRSSAGSSPPSAPPSGATSPRPASGWTASADVVPATQNQYFGFLVERLSVSLDILTGQPDVQERDRRARRALRRAPRPTPPAPGRCRPAGCARQFGGLGDFAPALRTMIEESEIAATWRAPYGLALLDERRPGGRHGRARRVRGAAARLLLAHDHAGDGRARGRARPPRRGPRASSTRSSRSATSSASPPPGSFCVGLVATTLGQLAIALGDARGRASTSSRMRWPAPMPWRRRSRRSRPVGSWPRRSSPRGPPRRRRRRRGDHAPGPDPHGFTVEEQPAPSRGWRF